VIKFWAGKRVTKNLTCFGTGVAETGSRGAQIGSVEGRRIGLIFNNDVVYLTSSYAAHVVEAF
jgi:hypothetical protein